MSDLSHRTSDYLCAALNDANTPASEIYDACHDYLNIWGTSKETYPKIWLSMEPLVFKNWSNDSSIWLLKGEAYINMAWLARGNDTADKVTEEGWKSFRDNLATAEDSLDKAWQLNSKDKRIPYEMMTVELGQGKGRDRMELWFNRDMSLDASYYDACSSKLYYLEPKWYGSTEAMLEFGRECVTNQAWGGHIPLILLDAHKSIQRQYVDSLEKTNYWKQPEVWTDLKSAFDRFFELNPDAIGWYHDYAWYAYQAEQWDTLNKIIPKLGPINYSFFGGTNEFNKMVQLAKENAGKPK